MCNFFEYLRPEIAGRRVGQLGDEGRLLAVSEVVSVAGRVANVPQGAANGAQGPAGSSPKVLQALDFEAKTWNAPTTPYKRRLVEPDEDTSSRPKTSQ